MNDDRDPLEQRLRQALPTDVPDDTRSRHLAALDAALTPAARQLGWRHRLNVVLASAVAAVTPVGVAVAAEGAVPGDVLYPVKQVTEQVQAFVRDEVVLEHRVEELDVLLDRDDTDDDTLVSAVDRGLEAAADQPDEPELQQRMSGLALEAAARVRDADRLALDRLPTRRLDRDRPTDRISPVPDSSRTATPDAQATASPTSRATARPTTDASPRPSDEPTRSPSPSPAPDATRSPMPPEREPSPSPSPEPKPSPTRDDRQPLRTERHEARDAGTVFIDVYRDGIRLAGVRPADGWEHRVDRSREPEVLTVGFARGDRRVFLTARWIDGEVRVSVEERRSDTTTADRAGSTAPGDGAVSDAR